MPTEVRDYTPQRSPNTKNRYSEYKGRDRSPFKAHHNGCLCKVCKCVVPKRSHRCAPKEPSKYPSDLKSVMQEDYIPKSPKNYDYNRDRHLYKPESRPFRSGQKGTGNDDLDTEYRQKYRGTRGILSRPFVIDHESHVSYPLIDKGSEYDRMTKSVQKGSYVPLSSIDTRKSHNKFAHGSGRFGGKSLYQDDFKGD